jgi:hypothetical protein
MADKTWSDADKRERLACLWAQGLSAREIGKEFGCSRNAVIGAVSRLDLPKRRKHRKAEPAASPATERPRPPSVVGKPRRLRARVALTKDELRAELAQAWRNTIEKQC